MSQIGLANFENFATHARNVIASTYGADVYIKPDGILKFGQNDAVGTSEETVMQLQGSETEETYVSTNAITHVVTDNAANTQTMTILGHTIDTSTGGLTAITQDVTLTGLTAVALGTPLARVSRGYVKNGTFASPATNLAASSSVYVYEGGTITSGVPDTASETHMIINAKDEQSLKAAFAVSYDEYLVLTGFYAGVNKKTTATVDIRIKVCEIGGVFRTRFITSVATAGANFFNLPLDPPLIIKPNSDIIVTAESSAVDTSVSAGFNAYFAKVRS